MALALAGVFCYTDSSHFTEQRRGMRKIVYGVTGVLSLLVGFVGLFLPILPGVLFLLLGLSLLISAKIPLVSVFLERLKKRILTYFKFRLK